MAKKQITGHRKNKKFYTSRLFNGLVASLFLAVSIGLIYSSNTISGYAINPLNHTGQLAAVGESQITPLSLIEGRLKMVGVIDRVIEKLKASPFYDQEYKKIIGQIELYFATVKIELPGAKNPTNYEVRSAIKKQCSEYIKKNGVAEPGAAATEKEYLYYVQKYHYQTAVCNLLIDNIERTSFALNPLYGTKLLNPTPSKLSASTIGLESLVVALVSSYYPDISNLTLMRRPDVKTSDKGREIVSRFKAVKNVSLPGWIPLPLDNKKYTSQKGESYFSKEYWAGIDSVVKAIGQPVDATLVRQPKVSEAPTSIQTPAPDTNKVTPQKLNNISAPGEENVKFDVGAGKDVKQIVVPIGKKTVSEPFFTTIKNIVQTALNRIFGRR